MKRFIPLLIPGLLCALFATLTFAQDVEPIPPEEPEVVVEPTPFEAALSFAANTEALPQIEEQVRVLQDQIASLQAAAAGDRAVLEQSISTDRPIRIFDLGGGNVVVAYFAGTSTQIRVLSVEGPDDSGGGENNASPELGQ